MTTPNLEQIARASEAVGHIKSILQTKDEIEQVDIELGSTAFKSLRRWATEAVDALRQVAPQPGYKWENWTDKEHASVSADGTAPQPAKEEVGRAAGKALAHALPFGTYTVGQLDHDRILSSLAPYLDAGREPHPDTQRVDHLLAINAEMNRRLTGNYYLPETRGGVDTQLDSAAAGREAT